MITCRVEMWGLSRELSGVADVEVRLEDNAGLRDLVSALRDKIPALEGTVIVKGANKLDQSCAFNIDGQFYEETDSVKLRDGQSIRLLTMAVGG